MTPGLRGIAAALLVGGALASPSGMAAGHPFDLENPPPTSYASAVHLIRDELYEINQARESGNTSMVAQSATRIDSLARAVPRFSLTLSSALQDSAAGRILRTAQRLGALAVALRAAADAHDPAGVERQVARCAELLAVLDAYAPAQYVCPMHCERGAISDRPGTCPVCGMHLQRVTSDRYGVEVRPVEGKVRARAPVTLDFQIRDPAGFDVSHLEVVHEKLLHLMIVSSDLSRFAHVHPTPRANGRFTLRHTFPAGGRYVLFHDFTPDSVGMQVVPVEIDVEGADPPAVDLVVDDDAPKRIDGYDVALSHTRLAPGIECSMTFTLTRGGKPVTDLEPFLGAAGHLVMISQDRAAYVHSHPLEPVASAGPRVEFKTTFTRTGLYKTWGQFQHRGRVLTVPFVVEVSLDGEPSSPAAGTSDAVR